MIDGEFVSWSANLVYYYWSVILPTVLAAGAVIVLTAKLLESAWVYTARRRHGRVSF